MNVFEVFLNLSLVLSRSNSEGTLDETKALLSEDDQRPKDGQLELQMTSSSGESTEINTDLSKTKIDK